MVDWPGSKAKFIADLLPKARERLVTIADDIPLIQAAKLFQAGADLVIVCDSVGLLVGVITKTDIVAQIRHCRGAICTMAAALVMTRDVVLCEPKDLLRDVWMRMKARGLKTFQSSIRDSGPWGCFTHATFCRSFSAIRKTKMPCCGIM